MIFFVNSLLQRPFKYEYAEYPFYIKKNGQPDARAIR